MRCFECNSMLRESGEYYYCDHRECSRYGLLTVLHRDFDEFESLKLLKDKINEIIDALNK